MEEGPNGNLKEYKFISSMGGLEKDWMEIKRNIWYRVQNDQCDIL
jgi:hypothetical protein